MLTLTGSANGSSENDPDEAMDDVDDVDIDGDADPDGDGEGDDDNDENEEDEEEQDQDDNQDPFSDSPSQSQSHSRMQSRPETSDYSPLPAGGLTSSLDLTVPLHRPPTSQPHPTVLLTSPSPPRPSDGQSTILFRPTVRPEALNAPVYDIVPTIAAPHSTSINAITATPDMRWVFTGGADGYIRKFNWIDTVNGKVMLTVAQRHPFVDSVTKAGVLMSYWENEELQCE